MSSTPAQSEPDNDDFDFSSGPRTAPVPFKLLLRVFGYLRPYWRWASLSGLVIAVSAFLAVLTPWPLKIVIDNVVGQSPLPLWLARVLGSFSSSQTSMLLVVVLGGLLITLLVNCLHVFGQYVNTRIDQYLALDFRSQLFLHSQRMSIAFHDRRKSGMLIYLINSQGDAPSSIVMAVPMIAESVLTLIAMFAISLSIDWSLALASLAVVPFLYYSVGYYATHIQARLQNVKTLEGESLSVIHESLSMMRVIVAFGREEHEYRRFREQTETAVKARVRVTVKQTLFSLCVNMITAAGTAAVLGLGAYHVIQGKITAGQMLVVIAYIAAVYKPLETISYTVGTLQDKFVSLAITFNLLDTQPDIKDSPHAKPMRHTAGHIVYDKINFSYSGRTDTLKGVSFEANPGQVIGIVGPTGAGKTTLVSLLPRFYDPKAGRILLDGRDLRDLTLKSLRDQISVVLQEPLLFSGSIAENIRYGRLDATHEEIIAAAKGANAHDFIMRLPQKYDTMLGERGAAVSGGERQRISVARAFLKNAPVLILDEPTSSVDSKTEAVILEALDRLMAGRTTFLIAHRLSSLRHADKILVVNHGELVEQGNERELLARNGLYKQLHDAQIGSFKRKEPHHNPELITTMTA